MIIERQVRVRNFAPGNSKEAAIKKQYSAVLAEVLVSVKQLDTVLCQLAVLDSGAVSGPTAQPPFQAGAGVGCMSSSSSSETCSCGLCTKTSTVNADAGPTGAVDQG